MNTTTMITEGFLIAAMVANAIVLVQNVRLRKVWQESMSRLSTKKIAEDIGHQIEAQVGLHSDLIERTITDLTFLHGQLYGEKTAPNHCPTESTIQELERVGQCLRTLHMEIELRKDRQQ